MLLLIIAFLGGVLTILSPCILPVLPFVFSRAGQPFRRSGLPLLIGMALTFALVGTLAAVAGNWVVRANEYGRYVALVIFAIVGISLLFPAFAEYLSRPFVRLGARVQGRDGETSGIGRSILLGVSTGLLWAPCAGPILGLILTGAAVEGASLRSFFLLTAFAVGAIGSLAIVLLAGNRVMAGLKSSLGVEVWIRRAIGAAVILGVIAIGAGLDTGFLARLSLGATSGFEQSLLDRLHPAPAANADAGPSPNTNANTNAGAANSSSNVAPPSALMMMKSNNGGSAPTGSNTSGAGVVTGSGGAKATPDGALVPVPVVALDSEGDMQSLAGATGWLNSAPLTKESLAGKVVVIDFWTYSCINCLRSIPYLEAWYEKYKNDGLVVIGVHTPEFAFERDPANVARAVKSLKLTYPIAIDSNRAIWNAFNNMYWPAHYFIDAQGKIRYHHFGEGEYDKSEAVIQELLAEKDSNLQLGGLVHVAAAGAQAAPDVSDIRSPETYIGFERQENYVSPERIAPGVPSTYTAPARLDVNQWALAGRWTVEGERATLSSAPGKIVFRFHARDLHLVLGPSDSGKPIRFRVRVDGAPPLADAGVDVDSNGNGTVREYRLYQLIRQKGKVEDRTFEIEFLDPGVQAFAFTFG